MNPKTYTYVGPAHVRDHALTTTPPGTPIGDSTELLSWLHAQAHDTTADGSLVATFVINLDGELVLAPRRSEHVACAGGADVLSAGEITFEASGGVTDISNQSTGYCPEPASWPAVDIALRPILVQRPGDFTTKVVFRLCPSCHERNLVKDNWLVCALCDADLPATWNFR